MPADLFIVFLALQVVGSILYGGLWPLYWFLLLGPILLFTVLIHELGHSLAARQVGGKVEGILLWPLGGLAFIGHDKGPKGVQGSAALQQISSSSRSSARDSGSSYGSSSSGRA
jgi:Zn-dependent protease